MSSVRQALFDRYNHDRRRKTLPPHSMFCVDDRRQMDVASDGSLYGYFCEVFADVANDPIVEVRLTGNVPIGPEVKAWASANSATLEEMPRCVIEFSVAPGEEGKLLKLADAIEVIVSRRYERPSYKYVCPRTAESLRRLANVLSSAHDT